MKSMIRFLGLAMLALVAATSARSQEVPDVPFFDGDSQNGSTNKFQVFVPGNGGSYAAVTSFSYFFDVASEPATFKVYQGINSYKVTTAASASATNVVINNPNFTSSVTGITTNDVVIIPDTGGYILRTVSSSDTNRIGLSAAIGRALTTQDSVTKTDNGQVIGVPNSQNGTNDLGFVGRIYLPGRFPHCVEGVGAANGLKGRGAISGYIAR